MSEFERTCRFCHRRIVEDVDGQWIDPNATGDDSIWRETCDSHDTFTAEHEPEHRPLTVDEARMMFAAIDDADLARQERG